MPGGRPGHKPGSPEYLDRKRRQSREVYRRHRQRMLARTSAYQRAQAGRGPCQNCDEYALRRVWVRSGSWLGQMCGSCTRETRRAGLDLVLVEPPGEATPVSG